MTGAKAIQLHKKLDDPAAMARIDKEFEKGGSYYDYQLTKIQADWVCSNPLIGWSRYQQEQCAELRIKVLLAKMNAYNKTGGAAEFLESIGK